MFIKQSTNLINSISADFRANLQEKYLKLPNLSTNVLILSYEILVSFITQCHLEEGNKNIFSP